MATSLSLVILETAKITVLGVNAYIVATLMKLMYYRINSSAAQKTITVIT